MIANNVAESDKTTRLSLRLRQRHYLLHCESQARLPGPNKMVDKTYTISELAQEFGVTTRTIRFYEEKGLIQPLRDGQKRLYTPADRVRIKLILRGKRIGMTLQDSVDLIDLYDPSRNNAQQLNALINTVVLRRATLLQQQKDIDDMLTGLDEVQALCEKALGKHSKTT
jgi:DNA-binding transcriptional MerR regulator